MSYQVLARKWRPHNFQQVVGQQHVLTALINALDQDRLHHAYLLSGTRGVGKTTIARILAKSLNCEQGITSKPCGQCSTCQEIDQGSYVDLLEIDAASRTKVEDTRELLDNVQYKPARGRFKVYLIDEVHMLSKHSFNALLKTLEEPPEYVKFLLATTDPQKLPITILSRCLQFHLKSLTKEQISQQLVHILAQEQCQYELTALNAIAKAADGSMRDALSLTDQALSHGSGEIRHQAVLDMLGTLDHHHIIQLLQLLVNGDANACMAKIAEVSSLGPDFDQLHIELASLLHRIAMAQILPSSLVDTDQADTLSLLCQQMSPEDVQLYYQISLNGRKELPLAPDPRSALEMTVLRLLAFRPQGSIKQPEVQQQVVANPSTASQTTVINPSPVVTSPIEQANVAPQPEPQVVTQTAAQPMPAVSMQDIDAEQMSYLNNEQSEIMQAAQDMGYSSEMTEQVPVNLEQPAHVAPQVPAQESQASQSAPVQEQNSIEQVRSTRNFLRSRLGASAKKPIATKSEPTPSSPYTPPKKVATQVTQPAQAPGLSQSNLPPANTNSSNNNQLAAPGHAPAQADYYQNMPSSADLPPLDAYQDNGNQQSQNYRNSQNNTSEQRQIERFSHVNVDINDLSPAFQQQQTKPATEARPIDNKLRDETDTWCRYINQMALGGRVRLLAMHSVLVADGEQVSLLTSPEQRHSVNEKSKQQLLEALTAMKGQEVSLDISFGVHEDKQTPAQIEEKIYQQRLASATHNLYEDKHIQFFINRLGAELDDNSIVPL